MVGTDDSAADMQRLLQRYHASPGRTPAMLQAWKDDAGRTSYEVLAARMTALARSTRVLDLACGDGFLLEMLAGRGFTHLTGVDASREELAAASKRLGSAARLHCQDIRAMSLPDPSFDVVVCHMALMLVTPIETVLAEIARVLVPGGRFIAVINRALRDLAYEVVRRELHRMTRESGMEPLRSTDPRVFTVEGLTELLRGQSFAANEMQIEDFCIRTQDSPAAVWSRLQMMYDVFRLPASAQSVMEQRVLSGWRPLCNEGGQLTCALGMRIIDCRSASECR